MKYHHHHHHHLILPLLLLLSATLPCSSLAQPGGLYINCGASEEKTIGGIKWIPDDRFISSGNKTSIQTPGLLPFLSTMRTFPDQTARKSCYTIPTVSGAKYLVRTTYFYGGFDGGKAPPVFDQIIGGDRWSTVNTSNNYAKGLTSYYEIVVAAGRKSMSICLARKTGTPFISTLELQLLADSMYNSTDFAFFGLSTVARHHFGHDGDIISYPDDRFNRYWDPFVDNNPVVEAHSNVTSSDFWNLPPARVFRRALTTSRGKQLVVQWPQMSLPKASYYVALYFQENRTPSPYSWRVFNVSLNNVTFYAGLNVSTDGSMVYATRWPLDGNTTITLVPDEDSPVGPVINAGEILLVVPLDGKTSSKDVFAMEAMASSLSNVPADWNGDPCLPEQLSWTGVECSYGKHAHVRAINLTGYGISGSLPDSIGRLTAITKIFLGGNKLTGPIPPQIGNLTELVYLHLEDNQFNGTIPSSLGNLKKIKEIDLQNNKLQGEVPQSLKAIPGVVIRK